METRIILTVLCFAMSFISLIRGLYLISLERNHTNNATINVHDAVQSLKLCFFNGIKSRNGIVLIWESDAKTGRWGFSVERKNDNGEYVEIAHFNYTGKEVYKFVDTEDFTAKTEYRLKQTDPFGGVYYSKKVLASRC